VYPELQNLYHWLEVEFNPLKLASRIQSSLEFISKKEELVQYTSALQDITIMRIVKQVITAVLHIGERTTLLD
jgi:translation initiation factor 3 subunit A